MIRIAVIGAGRWGPNYVRNFRELDSAEVVAIADRSAEALQMIARRFPEVQAVSDYHDLIDDSQVDAIVIATPAETHHEIGIACLQAGKHVLIEKPLASSAGEALEMARCELAPGQIFMVGHIFRFHPGINKVREILYEGTLGKVRYVHCVRTNLGPVRRDVSVIWDLAPHDISIALHLLNEMPVTVSATMGNYLHGSRGDVAFVNLLFPNGELVNIHVSWVDPQKRREVEIIGTNALMRFDDMNLAEPVRIIQRSLRDVPSYTDFGEFQLVTHAAAGLIPAVDLREPLREQCQHFVRSIETQKAPLSDVRDGYRICAILEAAEASARQGGTPVAIEAEDV